MSLHKSLFRQISRLGLVGGFPQETGISGLAFIAEMQFAARQRVMG